MWAVHFKGQLLSILNLSQNLLKSNLKDETAYSVVFYLTSLDLVNFVNYYVLLQLENFI